eukprot:278916-Rhodomonas_salina.1
MAREEMRWGREAAESWGGRQLGSCGLPRDQSGACQRRRRIWRQCGAVYGGSVVPYMEAGEWCHKWR